MSTTRSEGGGSTSTVSPPPVSEFSPEREWPGIHIRPDGRQLAIVLPRYDNSGSDDSEEGSCNSEEDSGEDSEEEKSGKREKISEFTERSRRNLRKLVHSMERHTHALFMGLTWHEYMPSPAEAKAALNLFSVKFRKRFPGAAYIWKLEPQDRGYPHFHLFVYGVKWVDPQKISELWHECTNEVSDQHRKSGVDVEWVQEDGKVQAYLAKYFSKTEEKELGNEDEPWDWPRRFWGKCNAHNLPYAEWGDKPKYLADYQAIALINDLLEEWDVDIPDGVIPPTLMINTRGDPAERMDELLDRLGPLMG